MEYNKDKTIEVGDLVRVVNPNRNYADTAGMEFVVDSIDSDGDIWRSPDDPQVGVEVFYKEELEIMQPKAELESVLEEDRRLEKKKDELWERCKYVYDRGPHARQIWIRQHGWDLEEIFGDE